ncbi:MAG: oxidoreductase [Deltaproteobacteria bacterium HGW-Deltaproteobacteria-12]|jgi:UDP-2-acetamido-3-amino-2,3-dideoxy-glucuronate N-acetyltransferase|nr:MAG: oxidoreductase [Deltaproteobacteria bacterium HGW-Deltaproteobacteria-12]
MKKTDKNHIAVVGAGNWGKNLIRNFFELGALRAICDENHSTLASMKMTYPSCELISSFPDLLARRDIPAIAIATPAETHLELARLALLAGKDVFVEKPLTLAEKDAGELIALAGKQKSILMVGHLLQYHPAFIKLKELAFCGDLGRINYIYSHRLNLGKIRREENILWSFAPHDISMILALAGEEPESVLATGGNYLHKKIADVTTTHLEFSSGLKAHIFVSWLHPFKDQKLVVVGDRKMAVFDDTLPWEEKLQSYPHYVTWENNIPVPTRGIPERVSLPYAEPLKLECEHFLSCLKSRKHPLTNGEEGLRVLKVLNAAERSLEENGSRIRLNNHPSSGAEENYYIHPSAQIDENVDIGAGVKIWHFTHIIAGSKIGANCSIGQNAVIGPDVTVGRGCKIQNNVSLYKGVTLEDNVFCGPSAVFTNVINPRSEIKRMAEIKPTLVKKGATLGANCTIVCGHTIGSYAFVGAGAVVTADVPDFALVTGNPARQRGWICSCGHKLTGKYICPHCGNKYVLKAKVGLQIRK